MLDRWVQENGFPEFVAFDNDLGEGQPEGWQFAQWLIEEDLDNKTMPEKFNFCVHSMNPVQRIGIEDRLNRYLEFKKNSK